MNEMQGERTNKCVYMTYAGARFFGGFLWLDGVYGAIAPHLRSLMIPAYIYTGSDRVVRKRNV